MCVEVCADSGFSKQHLLKAAAYGQQQQRHQSAPHLVRCLGGLFLSPMRRVYGRSRSPPVPAPPLLIREPIVLGMAGAQVALSVVLLCQSLSNQSAVISLLADVEVFGGYGGVGLRDCV